MRENSNCFVVLAVFLVFAAGAAAGAGVRAVFDPLRVAPHIFKLHFANERVRVLDVTIRNGETPPLHGHPDRLVVYLNACAWLETGSDGRTFMQSYTIGDVAWEPAVMHGGDSSNVVHDCRRLDIELLEGAPAGDATR